MEEEEASKEEINPAANRCGQYLAHTCPGQGRNSIDGGLGEMVNSAVATGAATAAIIVGPLPLLAPLAGQDDQGSPSHCQTTSLSHSLAPILLQTIETQGEKHGHPENRAV